MKRVERVIGGLSRAISGISLVGMTLIVVGNALSRALLGKSLSGSVTLSEYLLVASSFGALAYGQYGKAHVKMEALTHRLPPTARTTLAIIERLAVLIFVGAMTLSIGRVTWGDWQQKTGDWAVSFYLPVWIKGTVAALGSALLVLALLSQPWKARVDEPGV